jgi:hypothetical protein
MPRLSPTSTPSASDLRRLFLATSVAAAIVCLSGCSNAVSLEPAEDANNPTCAEVSARLPGSVSGEQRRWTDAQATGAWGNPAAVLLRCGVEPPGPSDLPCYSLGGVDWLAYPQEEDVQRAVTFGRDPALEVAVSREAGVDFATVLDELGVKIAAGIPEQSAVCAERAPAPPQDE